jgi:hypothetical protein
MVIMYTIGTRNPWRPKERLIDKLNLEGLDRDSLTYI